MLLFRTAGDISGFQSSKPEWAALFILGRGIHVTCSLRFASGATPADLLEASIKMIYYSNIMLFINTNITLAILIIKLCLIIRVVSFVYS